MQKTSKRYIEHIQYDWNQKTRATAGNFRLLEGIDLRRTFILPLAFIDIIVRYMEGVCRGLFLGSMSVCVLRGWALPPRIILILTDKDVEFRTHWMVSSDRFRCSNLFSVFGCSAEIATGYVTFIGWLWVCGTVERQASYIVFRIGLRVYVCYK